MRRGAVWGVAILGALGIAQQVSRAVPRENRVMISLSREAVVREVRVDVTDADGEPWKSVQLFPRIPNPPWIECLVNVPAGEYRIKLTYQIRSTGSIDKNQESDWTLMGVQHQIRLDGEDHHFPPPDHEAK